MPFTNEAVVFVSHFDVTPGHLPAFRAMWDCVVHVFPDPAAMTTQVLGADERSRAAYEHIRPAGWEVYGPAPREILAQLGETAVAAAVDQVIQPRALGGFLRVPVS